MRVDVFYDECLGCPRAHDCEILAKVKVIANKKINEMLDIVIPIFEGSDEVHAGIDPKREGSSS